VTPSVNVIFPRLLENTGHYLNSPLEIEYWEQMETFYLNVINAGHPKN
jgi:hypothetical protein